MAHETFEGSVMDKPRPKFCVGEEVFIVSYCESVAPSIRTEIIDIEWVDKARGPYGRYTGWVYDFEGRGKYGRADEPQVRKLPPEERTQWENCAWQPTKQGVEA